MSENSNIAWTDSTGSPWFGCTEQSPGCLHCYARQLTQQKFAFTAKDGGPLQSGILRRAYFKAGFTDWATRPVWGNQATRVLAKGFWTEAIRWNQAAEKLRTPHSALRTRRVFPSLMDWLDDFPAGIIDQEGRHLESGEALGRFLDLIRRTPHLDWLLLTKKIEDFARHLTEAWDWDHLHSDQSAAWISNWLDGHPPANAWLGVSVEDQTRANQRIPALLQTPARIRFLSVEPLLESIQFTSRSALRTPHSAIDWCIVGGESGPGRWDCGTAALESVIQQCARAGVPVFCKQDSHQKPGQKGRLSDQAWSFKEFPK